jgi:curli biogenesis system outer membrane secretion channel CsgG
MGFARSVSCVVLLTVTVLLSAQSAEAQDSQYKTTAARLGEQLQGAGNRRVGVVDVTDLNGAVSELGRSLANQFEAALFVESAAAGFAVIDRSSLRSLIREHKLASEGLIDVTTVRKLGQVSSVDCLVTGMLTPIDDNVRISIKALDSRLRPDRRHKIGRCAEDGGGLRDARTRYCRTRGQ